MKSVTVPVIKPVNRTPIPAPRVESDRTKQLPREEKHKGRAETHAG